MSITNRIASGAATALLGLVLATPASGQGFVAGGFNNGGGFGGFNNGNGFGMAFGTTTLGGGAMGFGGNNFGVVGNNFNGMNSFGMMPTYVAPAYTYNNLNGFGAMIDQSVMRRQDNGFVPARRRRR